jgi:predicted glycosyltransferase
LAQADLAVLQAGSTPFQLLGSDAPILLTARDFKSREQAERARRLAALPGVRLLPNDDPAWDDPLDWLGWGLERSRDPRPITLNLNGIANAADVLAGELALSRPG